MAHTIPGPSDLALPPRRAWTREEFQRMADLGFFGPEERLELIEGEIIKKMTQNSPPATSITLMQDLFRQMFSTGYVVRIQLPLALGESSQPEPDVAVVTGAVRDYAEAHPTTAVLIVEVSDTTLQLDRTTKAALYARAGIEEYWIVNISERILEVYRQPAAMPGQPLDHHYRSLMRYTETDTVSPLEAPQATIEIADLLP